MSERTAICPGTIDPITNGHVDLIQRSLRIFDRVIIAVLVNPQKRPLFESQRRIELIRASLEGFERVEVESFQGLLVNYVKERGGSAIIRGLRAVSDFEYELQMAHMNRRLSQDVETVFMMPSEEYSFLSSTIVKEIASFGGSLCNLVPEPVERALREVFQDG